MKKNNYIFDFEKIKNNPNLLHKIGGKASNLFHLTKSNIPVPKWWSISVDLFTDVKINKMEISFEELIANCLIPTNDFYAVRSSANAEDSAGASFSGQFSTLLYVPHHKLESAIKECWNSIHEKNVTDYLHEKNLNFSDLKMGVVIQKMAHSEKAGVMFTVDPTATYGKNAMVIVAGLGQGEGIVSSQVETDTYYLDRAKGKILHTNIEVKEHKLVFNKKSGSGLIMESVQKNNQSNPALNGEEIKKLFLLAHKIEQYYGYPQDIEWAIDQTGEIYIVQSRPITTLSVNEDDAQEFLLDNANIVESFPGITLPLTQSFVLGVYEKTFKASYHLIGFTKNEIDREHQYFSHLIHFYKGNAFYNLTSWFKIMRLIPFSKSYIDTWKVMLGISKDLDGKIHNKRNILSSLFIFFRSLFYVFSKFWNLKKELTQFKSRERKRITDFYETTNPLPTDKKELEKIFNEFEASYADWSITLLNDAYAFIYVGICQFIWTRFYHRPHGEFLGLLQIQGKVDSIAPVHSLNHLLLLLETNPQLRQEIQDFLATNKRCEYHSLIFSNENFNQALKNHLDLFGDRCFGELKLETMTYRENPALLLKLLTDQKNNHQNPAPPNTEAIDNFILNFFAKKARQGIAERENCRLLRSMKYGVIRRYCRKIGEDLCKNKAIEQEDDVFYLTRTDIYAFYNEEINKQQLRQIISTAKNEYHDYSQSPIASTYLLKKSSKSSSYQKLHKIVPTDNSELKNALRGIPCSQGLVEGKALVVNDPTSVTLSANELSQYILVTKTTDPGWVFLMKSVKGLIVERGSILSHSAIIGRELGLPTIISVHNATELIKSGAIISMNGETGEIFIK